MAWLINTYRPEVFEDFTSRSGKYNIPVGAMEEFRVALVTYDYYLEDYVWVINSNYDSILLDIYDNCGDRVGCAHIAWTRISENRFSVIGCMV